MGESQVTSSVTAAHTIESTALRPNSRAEHTQPSEQSSISTWPIPRFPLYAIGAIGGNTSSSPPPSEQYEAPYSAVPSTCNSSTGFLVYREISYAEHAVPFRLGQDSITGSGSTTSESHPSYDTTREQHLVYVLVKRAVRWLITADPIRLRTLVTPSIYWAIRSLPVFYSSMIAGAIQRGADPIDVVQDEDWPEEPEGRVSMDLSELPEWLMYILSLDELHQQGLSSITTRRVSLKQPDRVRKKFPHHFFIESIPVRELDDPPDSDEPSSGTTGIIEELSLNRSEYTN